MANGNSGRYTVYDNKDTLPVIVFGTSEECAKAMGVKVATFRSYLKHPCKRWGIFRHKKKLKA